MKIKDLADMGVVNIPIKKNLNIKSDQWHTEYLFEGYNLAKEEYDNLEVDLTKLDPNEICEVDVEKLKNIIYNFDGNSIIYYDHDTEPCLTDRGVNNIAQAIAKAGCIKFKQKGEE